MAHVILVSAKSKSIWDCWDRGLDLDFGLTIIKKDLVIQDIELGSMEISPSTDHMIMNETEIQQSSNVQSSEVQQDPIGCVSGIDIILKTIQMYMKNSIISLLVVSSLLPWYSTLIYGFISNSGCEDPTIKFMVEMSEYSLYMATIFSPLLIKLKLDRLSE